MIRKRREKLDEQKQIAKEKEAISKLSPRSLRLLKSNDPVRPEQVQSIQ